MKLNEYLRRFNLSLEEIRSKYSENFSALSESTRFDHIKNFLNELESNSAEIIPDINAVISKIQNKTYHFEKADTLILSTFIAKGSHWHMANFINTFKEGTLLDDKRELQLFELFNAIKKSSSIKTFTFKLNKTLRQFLPHLFSIIKHIQDNINYPLNYPYYHRILAKVLQKKSDYDSLCTFYKSFPAEERSLNFSVYMELIGNSITQSLSDGDFPFEPKSAEHKALERLLVADPQKSELEKIISLRKNAMSIKEESGGFTGYPKPALNTILYGPPGTGKTYHSVRMAAEIIKGVTIKDYDEAKQIFQENLHDRIEFITFHQNYSYEDFIEGLRPDIDDDSLKFKRIDGVFKSLVNRATKRRLSVGTDLKDYTVVRSNAYIIELERKKDKKIRYIPPQLVGDILRGINEGKITLDQVKDRRNQKGSLGKLIDSKVEPYLFGFDSTLYQICNYLLEDKQNEEKESYVLIIDEINRANISRVFGELITLLEEDKRSGGEHPLETKLPSGELFQVPSNLYVIGTMNTADRSIALLDIALRRRFEFKPMYPENVAGVHDWAILEKLNKKIIADKGYDFQIGHSFFMGKDYELIPAMNKKVIPLLLEYYMNESKKVEQLLSDTGFTLDKGKWPLEVSN
jgi:hypothetical protein